jgi:hypothetical protein
MKIKIYKNFKIYFFSVSFLGFIFSSYMSFVKFFSKTCAFGETCPLFLGIPACYFGFLMFSLLFMFSILFIIEKWETPFIANLIFYTSMLGVIFSGFFAFSEIPLLIENGLVYKFGLPTCILGFIFFFMIFIVSVFFKKNIKND